jgi:hypothetical protein
MRAPSSSRLRTSGTLLLVALSVAACGNRVEYGGSEVADPEALVASLDGRLRQDVTTDGANTNEDSRCYLARPKSGPGIDPTGYCGPVRRFGGTGKGVWDTYKLTPAAAAGENRISLTVGQRAATGVEIPSSIELFRPDGEDPPGDADELAAPPAPSLPPGSVTLEPGQLNPVGAAPAAGADAVIITPELSVVLTGTATTGNVDLASGPRTAADGEELLLATLKLAGGPAVPDPNTVASTQTAADTKPSLAAIVGDKRYGVPLEDEPSSSFGQSPSRPKWDVAGGRAALEGNAELRTLVVSAPKGAPVLLGVSVAGKEQTLDLRSGTRAGNVSGAFYRPNLVAPVAASYPATSQKVGDFTGQLGAYVDKIYLTSFDAIAGWAPEGQAFLVVPMQDVPTLNGGYPYEYRPDTAKTSTLTAGPQTYKPLSTAGAPNSIVFQVPLDFTKGTFVYRPTGRFSGSEFSTPRSGTFRAAKALTIPVSF